MNSGEDIKYKSLWNKMKNKSDEIETIELNLKKTESFILAYAIDIKEGEKAIKIIDKEIDSLKKELKELKQKKEKRKASEFKLSR